jgi:hypothetical protein
MDPQMNQLTDDLTKEFEPAVTRDTVHRVVSDSFGLLAGAITFHMPILAPRLAFNRDEIKAYFAAVRELHRLHDQPPADPR